MSDLISREEAIARATHEGAYGYISAQELAELPSAERKGKWISDWNREIKMIDGCPDGSCHCSYCGEWLVASDEYLVKGIYCPNCGARMVEGEEE